VSLYGAALLCSGSSHDVCTPPLLGIVYPAFGHRSGTAAELQAAASQLDKPPHQPLFALLSLRGIFYSSGGDCFA
jgi:hypothetical protein